MPAPMDEIVKRRVSQQWLSGNLRPKTAIDNNIGEGTISSIINYFKVGLDAAEFNSARELALQAFLPSYDKQESISRLIKVVFKAKISITEF